ncbi:MAG: pseudouridine synthase [Deltaproteobacteria bacterium]|nr:MAG: pseudouridine synthase [Deltaproteobacteria bacterium]
MAETMRLQKYLAQCGVCSRRRAEEYIRQGLVAVNGKIVTRLGTTIAPDQVTVTFDGKKVQEKEAHISYLLNKPKGYVTTNSDPQGRPTVVSLIQDCRARLFPVGRLDFDTEGALILTNDGELAQKITHPRYMTCKTYEALVHGRPSRQQLQRLRGGILLEGKKTAPARIKVLTSTQKNTLVEIIIHEGRKRQIKKMFQHINCPVVHLKRTAYGQLKLGTLAIGNYRRLDETDIKRIFL